MAGLLRRDHDAPLLAPPMCLDGLAVRVIAAVRTIIEAARWTPRGATIHRMPNTMTGLLFGRITDDRVREAAWVARCVGRADTAPFGEADLSALASYLTRREA